MSGQLAFIEDVIYHISIYIFLEINVGCNFLMVFVFQTSKCIHSIANIM